ncbi:MAG: hypothetical protein APF78_10390 [Sphingomonadales bacterium BRH_c3]|nr:MAG: hypothetical protein APF78_10390 [Sphingomonadales bacterium BRH_c3]
MLASRGISAADDGVDKNSAAPAAAITVCLVNATLIFLLLCSSGNPFAGTARFGLFRFKPINMNNTQPELQEVIHAMKRGNLTDETWLARNTDGP